MHPFTTIFPVALLAATAARFWLAGRQIASVRAHRNAVPPAFEGHIDLASHRKAADYTEAKIRLNLLDVVVSAFMLLGFTLGGGIQILIDAWGRVFNEGGLAHGVALIASVSIIAALVELPFSLYRTFSIEARFGFNKITPRLFMMDLLKSTILGALIGLPMLLLVLWLMDIMGDRWWLYVWFAWMGFNLVMLVLYPLVIAPIFNRFTPLEDQRLRERVEVLLQRCGFRSKGLFVMDGSKRSAHGNAYFTGFGAGKRIVFFDTLLARLRPEEIEAVLAHELGHFKRRHIIKRIAILFATSFAMLALLGYLADQLWFYQALGVEAPSTAAALLLFTLVMPVFGFALQPVSNAYSRKHEYEADAYAAQQSNAGDLISALVKLYQDNAATLTPDPIHSAFYDSHPPAGLRIARLQTLTRHEGR